MSPRRRSPRVAGNGSPFTEGEFVVVKVSKYLKSIGQDSLEKQINRFLCVFVIFS